MHCNLREAARATPALSLLQLRRHTKFEVAEPIHCRIIAFLLLIHHFTPWPWHCDLTFDIWPWIFAVYCLWRDETLYQIWTQSSNPRRSTVMAKMSGGSAYFCDILRPVGNYRVVSPEHQNVAIEANLAVLDAWQNVRICRLQIYNKIIVHISSMPVIFTGKYDESRIHTCGIEIGLVHILTLLEDL